MIVILLFKNSADCFSLFGCAPIPIRKPSAYCRRGGGRAFIGYAVSYPDELVGGWVATSSTS